MLYRYMGKSMKMNKEIVKFEFQVSKQNFEESASHQPWLLLKQPRVSQVFYKCYKYKVWVSKKKNEFKKTIVKKGVTFGANSTIVCGITIGEYAFIGAGSLIHKNIKPYSLVVGVPFQQIGWMSKFGEKLDLPIEGSGITKCLKTGCEYKLINGNLNVKEKNENW